MIVYILYDSHAHASSRETFRGVFSTPERAKEKAQQNDSPIIWHDESGGASRGHSDNYWEYRIAPCEVDIELEHVVAWPMGRPDA